MVSRKPILIGIGLGLAGVIAVVWTIANQPLATGRVLTGKVIYCERAAICVVRLEVDSRTVPVDMAREFPGQQISLIEMRRRLTGGTQYLVRGRGKL
jgi:hypothetical protein